MVDNTVSTVPEGIITQWERPPTPLDNGLVPWGEIVFAGLQVLPIKAAVDQDQWILQMNFERNFHYRVIEFSISVVCPFEDDIIDWEPAMRVIVSSDAPGFVDYNFLMVNQLMSALATSTRESFQSAFAAVTNDTRTQFVAPFLPSGLIDASGGAARLFLNWMNVTGNLSNAVTVGFRMRALIFTTDQARNWPIHTPLPIIPI